MKDGNSTGLRESFVLTEEITLPRLAILMPEYPGPSQTFIRRDVAALRELGAHTEIFSTRRPETLARGWGPAAEAETTYLTEINHRALFALPRGLMRLPFKALVGTALIDGKNGLRDLLLAIPLAAQLSAECRKRHLHHIHAHMSSRAATVAALASHMTGLPYSITLHGDILHYGRNQRINWSHPAFGIAVSSGLIDGLNRAIFPARPKPMVVQPMGVDTETFTRSSPYRPRQQDEPLRLFSCGRINSGKGHDVMITALARLVAEGEDAYLEIAGAAGKGQAAYAQRLRALIDDLGVSSRVTMLGAYTEHEVHAALLRSHIFVLASRSEGLGIVYVEALACAVPTVGTRVGGVPDVLVDEVTGLLVPPDDPGALATAILRISRDPDLALRLSAAGREWAVTRFDVRGSARALLRHAFPEWAVQVGI